MRHVLIVDDALDLGRLLKTALSMIDTTMPIVVVPSGEEALLEGARYPLDLLVTDIRLPGITGVELIRKIRKQHPDVKIIVITGLSDDKLMKEIRDLGVDALFNKPLSIPEFTDTAKRCLYMETDNMQGTGLITAAETPQELTETTQRLADVLSALRSRLGAVAVALIDERGRISAQAGELPDQFWQEEVATRIRSTSSAGDGLAKLLGKTKPENVMAFHGVRYNLVLAPVIAYSVFALLDASSSHLRLALCIEEFFTAQSELTNILEALGFITTSSMQSQPRPELQKPAAEQEELGNARQVLGTSQLVSEDAIETIDTGAFAAIFEEKAGGEMIDADRYWDEISTRSPELEPENPEVLTYEQARKLGLTPESKAGKQE